MKVAVITGAASGIGAGLAREAVARGMQVVLADRDPGGLNAIAQELGSKALAVVTDVTQQLSLDALADKAYAAFGQVDLLFNNAGVLSTGNCWGSATPSGNKPGKSMSTASSTDCAPLFRA